MTVRASTPSARGNPYFHGDHLDSVDTTSSNDGSFTRQGFDAFGAPQNPLEQTRSGFTGHQHDEELGLIDMRGRVYDPLASRFLTQDPIRSAPYWTQGQNPYSYVFNDPINATDPSGFFALVPGYPAGVAVQGSALGGLAQGVGFGIGNLGLSWLMGNPFEGVAGQTKAVAAGAHAAGVKGGGVGGPNAVGANDGEAGPPPNFYNNNVKPPPAGPDERLAFDPGTFCKAKPDLCAAAARAAADVVSSVLINPVTAGIAVGVSILLYPTELGVDPPPSAGEILLYHYTTAPDTAFLGGLRAHSWVTDTGSYTAQEASEKLGIPAPDKVLIIRYRGQFVPGRPVVVPPNRYGGGGGRQFYNPVRVPPTDIVGVAPVK